MDCCSSVLLLLLLLLLLLRFAYTQTITSHVDYGGRMHDSMTFCVLKGIRPYRDENVDRGISKERGIAGVGLC